MRKYLILFICSICACSTQAQVWTNYINALPNIGPPDIFSVAEDPNNQILYLGGDGFSNSFGQFTTNCIVKFDGVNFDTLQSGIDDYFPGNFSSQVRNLVYFKNKLYVFGRFAKAGKTVTKNMAVWDGSAWGSLTATGNNAPDFAYILNDEMYVWGLDSINGMKVTGLAKFDGTTWHDVPIPITPGHTADYIVNFQNKLYKSGQVTSASSDANLSYSDGTNWIPWVGISGDNNKTVFGMKVIDSLLWVYGRFNNIAGTLCDGFAAYNGTRWFGFGQGLSYSGFESVRNIQKINGELYITGVFDNVEGIGNSSPPGQYTNLAKFDGEKWCIVSPPFNNLVTGVIQYKNDLYAYGAFEKVGNDSIRSIGRYNGGFSETCSQPIAITMSTVGINDIFKNENLKIYPNPAKDQLTVEFSEVKSTHLTLEFYSIIGQRLFSKDNLEPTELIDLSIFPAGIYLLKIKGSFSQKIFKIVKE